MKGYHMAKMAMALRRRMLSLALIALLVQATLPYLLTTCPVYGTATSAHGVHATAMPADCPMLAMHQAKLPAPPAKHPADNQSALNCPLCAVMSPLHAFVVAGLIALPPPAPLAHDSVFTASVALLESLPATSAFFARGPPGQG